MNAFDKLGLDSDEQIEAVVFGEWGWDGLSEPEPAPVPESARGQILSYEEAYPYGEGWSFYGGYGSPECYAVNIWTNKRVLYVVQYNGSTRLAAIPRNPTPHMPEMPGR